MKLRRLAVRFCPQGRIGGHIGKGRLYNGWLLGPPTLGLLAFDWQTCPHSELGKSRTEPDKPPSQQARCATSDLGTTVITWKGDRVRSPLSRWLAARWVQER